MHRIRTVALILTFALVALANGKSVLAQSSDSTGRKVFASSIVPLTADRTGAVVASVPLETTDKSRLLELHFWLASNNLDELEGKLRRGESISIVELRQRYSGNAKDYAALMSWLKSQGFRISGTTKDRTSVYATATVAQIEKALHVTMTKVTFNGVTGFTATNAPSLPSEIGARVTGIDGLQPVLQVNRQSIWYKPPTDTVAAMQSTNFKSPPYLPSDLMAAYNGDKIKVDGSGQIIGVLIDTLPNNSDITAFWQRAKVKNSLKHIVPINVAGGRLPAAQGEETLDVSWTSGTAPGATIRIYAAGSLQFVALDKAMDRIMDDLADHPQMRQLSISLGLGETYMSPDELREEHNRFLRMAAAGLNVFVSSGDAGSNPGLDGRTSNGPLQVEYQSSDPAVIAVGGTTLHLDATTGKLADESGWAMSGGGVSASFAKPAWQVTSNPGLANKRLVPDVSSVADPVTGALIVLNGKSDEYMGGTSWSAPVWAAICALLNESRIKAGKPPLTFLAPQLWALRGTPAFRDITEGTNGKYVATPGYDAVTGLGVPNVAELIHLLGQ